MEMCFDGNQPSLALNFSFFSLYSKYQSSSFISLPTLNFFGIFAVFGLTGPAKMKKLLQLQPLPSVHPHATGVVVYLALLVKSEAFGVNNVRFYRSLIVQLWICKQALQGCT